MSPGGSGAKNGSGPAKGSSQPSREDQAEEVVARVAADVSRFLVKAWGRTREEMEDIVAEGRARYERETRRHQS